MKYVKKLDDRLKKCGYPLTLNGVKYFIIQIVCTTFSIYSFYTNSTINIIRSLAIIVTIEIYIILYSKIENSRIYNDMLYIIQSLYLQMNAGVTLKDGLKNLNILCKNKKLKKAVIILATRYELNGYDIKTATIEFEKQFNIPEIKLFTNALNQQLSSDVSIDMLSNLYSILKYKYIAKLNSNTKIKMIYITLGIAIILINICALIMFPIFIDIFQNLDKIFM